MRRSSLIFVALYTISIVLLAVSIGLENSISEHDVILLETKYGIVEVYGVIPKSQPVDVVAIAFPGFMSLPAFFHPIGNVLTQEGVALYAVSLSGSGRTSIRLKVDVRESTDWRYHTLKHINEIVPVFNETINALKEFAKADRIILLGEGMGGGLALHLTAVRDDVIATIIWSPSGYDRSVLNALSGKKINLLYLIGEFDDPQYADQALEMLKLWGISNPKVGEPYSPWNGSKVLVTRTRLSGSISHYFAVESMQAVADWISETIGVPPANAWLEYIRLILLTASVAFLALSSFALPSILSEAFGIFSGGKRWPKLEMKVRAIRMATTWTFAQIALFAVIFVSFLAVCSHLTIMGVETEVALYPTLLIVWSLSTWILARIYISRFLSLPRKEVYSYALSAMFEDGRVFLMALAELAIIMPPAMVWAREILVDPFAPNMMLFLLYLATLPLNIWALLLYEILFRRVLQESFGGATVSAALTAAVISVGLRMIIPVIIALIYFILGGFLLFPALLLIALFAAELAVELIAATLYYNTREVLPGAVVNAVLWYYFAYILSIRVTIILY